MKVTSNVSIATTFARASRIAQRIEDRTAKFNIANAADSKALAQLTGTLSIAPIGVATPKTKSGVKRNMSQETKDKISSGQAKRWADKKKGKVTAPAAPAETSPSAQTVPLATK